jgi:hypothetical protein
MRSVQQRVETPARVVGVRKRRKSEKSEGVKVLGLSEPRAREASAVESLRIAEGASLWQQDIGELTGHNLEARGREQVNRLLQEGWRLLHIYTLKYQEAGVWRERPMAILGKAREGRKGKKSLEACGKRLQAGRQTDHLLSDRFPLMSNG